MAEDQIVQGIVLATTACHTFAWTWKYFVAWTCCCLKVYFSSASSVCFSKACLSIFISIRYTQIKTNKVVHNAGFQVYPLLSSSIGVSPLHGLTVASLRITQIYITIDKVKIKPYLATPLPFHRLNLLIRWLLPFTKAA